MTLPKDPTKIEDYRRRISEAHKGKRHTPETCKKISEHTPARRPEVAAKKRAAMLGRHQGENHPMFGRHHTPESRLKISMAQKGIPRSEETRQKISKANSGKIRPDVSERQRGEKNHQFGKHLSDDHKRKISEGNRGKHIPQEQRKKIALSKMGDKNPLWRGGVSFEPYCPKFNEDFKERVREFFGHTCQFPGCGHVSKPGETKLAVHHVNFRKDSCCSADVKPLFVPLCARSCHLKTNTDREYWEQYFTDMINEQFAGQCYLPQKEEFVPSIAI